MHLTHIYPDNMPVIRERLRDYRPIVPLRRPLDNARSWKARKKDLGFLRTLWETMVSEVDGHDPVYLCIESPYRDEQLQRLSEFIGEPLETDWPKIASSGRTAELTSAEVEMFEEFEPFYAFQSGSRYPGV